MTTSKKRKIKIAVIGGSGLDDPQILKNPQKIKIKTPFGKPSDDLIIGKIDDQEVVILARHGKNHGIMPTKIPFRANIWALHKIGCTHILATTACGSLRANIKPSELIFPDQFIDFTKHRALTFHENKVIHTPMADPFCTELRKLLADSAKKLKIPHHKDGTNITIEGPRFSTRAESKMFRLLGADIINMSTVPEVILAREMGICYANIAMATDYDSWKTDEEPVTWEMILKTMEKNAENVKKLLLYIIPQIGDSSSCKCKG